MQNIKPENLYKTASLYDKEMLQDDVGGKKYKLKFLRKIKCNYQPILNHNLYKYDGSLGKLSGSSYYEIITSATPGIIKYDQIILIDKLYFEVHKIFYVNQGPMKYQKIICMEVTDEV